MRPSVTYRLRVSENSVIQREGYSKYRERIKAWEDETLPVGEEIYGLAQALDHREEILNKGYAFDVTVEKVTVEQVEIPEDNSRNFIVEGHASDQAAKRMIGEAPEMEIPNDF